MSAKNKNTVNEPYTGYGEPATFEQVWKLFMETDKKFKETDKLLTEKFQETDRKFQETDKKFQETREQMKETDKKIKELSNLFTSQWGRLIESLVEGDLVRLLNERGIPVDKTSERYKGHQGGENFEFDIIAHNGNEIVIVEVKTTLKPADVKEFTEKMQKAKIYLPEYANSRLIGAMAYLKADAGAETMAGKQGFFVIRATGNSAAIINPEGFVPKKF